MFRKRPTKSSRYVRLRELLVGIEGLALLRHLYDGSSADAAARLAEVKRLLDEEEFAVGEQTSEADLLDGYAVWADRYDEPGNPIIALEQPAMWSLLEAIPPGDALDAACGTGRHARRLVELGHRVTGIDATPQMLAKARINVPGVTFLESDLRSIPAQDGRFDAIVCGLAVAHVDNLGDAMAELGRVLRGGGTMLISALHPFQALLGWHAPFEDAEGKRRFVREYSHTHADYVSAFRAAGLTVRTCLEPKLQLEQLEAKKRAFQHIPEAAVAAYLGLPAVLVWEVEKA
jgi:ubiquinone/menaquinone biosynthesis C-methylase UbiE